MLRLWVAEGFLKLEKDLEVTSSEKKVLEGVAEKCLQDLIDGCLVLVSDKKFG